VSDVARGVFLGGGVLICGWVVVFEGEIHPYKENLIRFDGQIRRREPDVKTKVLKQKSM